MSYLYFMIPLFIWLGGTFIRIYRQMRFYQIEEYKSGRYFRWYFGKQERWLPQRPMVAALLGVLLSLSLPTIISILAVTTAVIPLFGSILTALAGVFFSEGRLLLVVISVLAVIAVIPPPEGEVKKAFKGTARATRILITACGLALTETLLAVLPVIYTDLAEIGLIAVSAIGLLIFLTTPFNLIAANILMTPIEAIFRRRFIAQARGVLAQVQPKVIGITGSYGKTTTKNFITDLLNGRYRAYATPKSYNTLMGISLAVNNDLANNYAVDYFVVEMGAYIRGEIRRIAQLTPPDIAVVVEVGPQHLERFGSLENIAIAKYEIVKALKPEGVAVFNWDNSYVRQMYERPYPNTRIAVSKTLLPENAPPGGPRFIASNIDETLNGLTFTITDSESGQSERFTTPVIGQHNVTNILLATAVAVHEGLTLREVAFAVRNLKPAESRLVRQTTPQGITIINDAYSANPAGVVSALRVLRLHNTGRRLLITPGMIELGALHEEENRKLGQIAAQTATDVILVGAEQTRPIYAGLTDAEFPTDRLQVVDTLSEAVTWYQKHLKPGDTVLFLNDLPDTY